MEARLAVYTALLALLTIASIVHAHAAYFQLYEQHWSNAVGGHAVYPGSQGVTYVATVVYNGPLPAENVIACIEENQVFAPSDGFSACTAAEDLNGIPVSSVQPGDRIVLRFHIDVSRSATPGWHSLPVRIYYRLANGTSGSEELGGASIYVSTYPLPQLRVYLVYWEPGGYPGTEGATLHVVLENLGSRIESGYAILELHRDIFYPSVVHVEVPAAGSGRMLDVAFHGISINASAEPGAYPAWLHLHVRMSTEDGVEYTSDANLYFNVSVEQPPGVQVELLDYGYEGLVAPGSRDTRIYVTFANRDPGVTIEAVYARLVAIDGLRFYNGSLVAYTALAPRAGYGGTFTIVFEHIDVERQVARATLWVDMLVSRQGAEYWVSFYKLLVLKASMDIGVRVLSLGWADGVAYPGSTGETIRLQLAAVGYERVAGGVAILALPEGFQPRILRAEIPPVQPGGVATISFNGVSVSPRLKPGYYRVNLTLATLLVDVESGARLQVNETIPVLIRVYEPPVSPLRIEAVWCQPGPCISGSRGSSLHLLVAVWEPGVRVGGGILQVILPEGFDVNGYKVVNLTLPSVGYGEPREITLTKLGVRASPGSYPIVVRVNALVEAPGGSYTYNETIVKSIEVEEGKFEAILSSYGWEGVVTNGTSGARIEATLTLYTPGVVRELLLKWEPVSGVRLMASGSQRLEVNAGYGSSVTVTSPPLLVESRVVKVKLVIDALVDYNGVYYRASRVYTLSLSANASLPAPRIEAVEILYQGSYAVLAPGERGVTLHLLLYNPTPYSLSSITAQLYAPLVTIEGISGSCLQGVAPGSVCALEFTLNVSKLLPPGEHPALLVIRYSLSREGYVTRFEARYALRLYYANPSSLASPLELVSIEWGSGRPSIVYPGAGLTPVTVTLVNTGRWEARAVTVTLEVNGLEPVRATAVCASSLPPGSACTATLYYRVGLVKPGVYRGVVKVSQVVYTYGLDMLVTQSFHVELRVYEPPLGGGLRPVRVDWVNNWPVYPGTSDARLQVVLANLEQYPVQGIIVALETPPGFHAEEVYAPGPIRPGQEATVELRVDVDSWVKPGCYNATLVAEYSLDVTGSPSITREWRVKLCVSDISEALEPVTAYWSAAAAPNTMGLTLNLVLRNKKIPEMTSIVAKVILPEGMAWSRGNLSIAVVPVPIQESPQVQMNPMQLARLLEALGSASQASQGGVRASTAPRGSFIVVSVPINIYSIKPGVYRVKLRLSFIDQWGSSHEYETVFTVPVLGSPKLVEASFEPVVVDVSGGSAEANLTVTLIGSAPAYDVYIAVVPRIPLLLPHPSILYTPSMKPGEKLVMRLKLYYNPAGLPSWQGGGGAEYAAVPFTVMLVYRDHHGTLHTLNATAVVQVAPFVRLQLGPDTRATYREGVLTVGGTVVNLGTATARSVTVEVRFDGVSRYTVIGDLEPGDQAAFRIDVETASPPEKVTLIVKYLDEYNKMHSKSFTLPVITEKTAGTAMAKTETPSVSLMPTPWLAAGAAATITAILFVLARRVRR